MRIYCVIYLLPDGLHEAWCGHINKAGEQLDRLRKQSVKSELITYKLQGNKSSFVSILNAHAQRRRLFMETLDVEKTESTAAGEAAEDRESLATCESEATRTASENRQER